MRSVIVQWSFQRVSVVSFLQQPHRLEGIAIRKCHMEIRVIMTTVLLFGWRCHAVAACAATLTVRIHGVTVTATGCSNYNPTKVFRLFKILNPEVENLVFWGFQSD